MPARGQARIAVKGVGQVMRALRAVERAAPRELRDELRQAMEPVRLKAAAKLPKGPGRQPGGGDNRLGHISDSLKTFARGNSAGLRSRHPGFGVVNFGGAIRPGAARGQGPIRFPSDREAVYSSLDDVLDDVQRDVRRRIERIGRLYGL